MKNFVVFVEFGKPRKIAFQIYWPLTTKELHKSHRNLWNFKSMTSSIKYFRLACPIVMGKNNKLKCLVLYGPTSWYSINKMVKCWKHSQSFQHPEIKVTNIQSLFWFSPFPAKKVTWIDRPAALWFLYLSSVSFQNWQPTWQKKEEFGN